MADSPFGLSWPTSFFSRSFASPAPTLVASPASFRKRWKRPLGTSSSRSGIRGSLPHQDGVLREVGGPHLFPGVDPDSIGRPVARLVEAPALPVPVRERASLTHRVDVVRRRAVE